MELVKKTEKFSIFKKRSGRFSVKGTDNKWVNGADKANILSSEGLIKLTAATKVEEAPAANAEEKKEETTEE
jgi:hypothetical protein